MNNLLFVILIVFIWSCSGGKSGSDDDGKKKKSEITDIYNYENAANHLRIGKYADGLLILQKIQPKHKDDSTYWNTLGMALRLNSFIDGDKDLRKREVQAFQKALSLKPDDLSIMINLASTLLDLGKKEEACSLFKKILPQASKHPEVGTITAIVNDCNEVKPEKKPSPATPPQTPVPENSSMSENPGAVMNTPKDKLQTPPMRGNNIVDMNAQKPLTMVPPMN
ncbi:hypothetical protein KKF34_15690 [Myxococcota bacterium]|nr:hypothetical protein [Myxococcota bacterium]MBU1380401.1 hypothetical protein [Myxococcota bacterium]MBU1498318.1 hypothetical protein [Myxococcota bacterium]